MDIEYQTEMIETLKKLVRQSIHYAKKSHDLVIQDKEDNPAAIAYLQRASAKMSSAESLYWSQIEILERSEAENIFHLFDVFADELTECFVTDHSHQWTDIEFTSLMDTFNTSVFAFENI